MPWPLGTAELQARLKNLLGIRGAIPLELDESILATAGLVSPRELDAFGSDPRLGIATIQVGNLAGNFSTALVGPGPGTLLQVDDVLIRGSVGAANRRQIRLVTQQGAGVNVTDRRTPWAAAATPVRLAALALGAQTVAPLTGTLIGDVTTQADTNFWVKLGVVLDGDAFFPAVGVETTAVNQDISVTFRVREYRKR